MLYVEEEQVGGKVQKCIAKKLKFCLQLSRKKNIKLWSTGQNILKDNETKSYNSIYIYIHTEV